MPTLTFLGAARTVTGSKYLLERNGRRLFIDCGLFQGLKELRERNWHDLPVEPATVDAVVLTHAHIDHCGYLPRLVGHGFRGRVFCTPGTMDLCGIVLPDAAKLSEEDARDANRNGYSRHAPALPLLTEADAYRALSQLQPVGFGRPIDPLGPASGLQIEFVNAGHLLGSASVLLTMDGPKGGAGRVRVLFGGDLGRYDRPILPDPSPRPPSDILLVESTYGDRTHPADHDGERLAQIVRETHARGGKLVIPSFAVGRVEEILYWLKSLERERRIPVLPVYLDSPMAIAALQFYANRGSELDADSRPGRGQLRAVYTERVVTVASGRQSDALVRSTQPAIIISSSGMATGGRVLHHLKATLPDTRNTVLFVGFQAAGTRGRQLVDGIAAVKIHGVMVPVAAKIERIDSMSAHADANENLRWLRTEPSAPRMTYLVHGEPRPMDALNARIGAELGWAAHAPEHGETVELEN
ncbi:MAG: MBL fold metallo-hydrolase [Acidobacteria bacterium]|nr:MBL fold metallo-hydrolase [Acidobacteriota bacterium]